MNPTLLITGGAVIAFVAVGVGVFYFLRYRHRMGRMASSS
jgi:uncharacterized membrane protein